MQRPRAVMLRNKVDDSLRQAHFPGQFYAVCDMANDDLRTLDRLQTVVRILARLIFDEVFGCRGFADVVIQSSDSREQTIGANGAASFFSQLPNGM